MSDEPIRDFDDLPGEDVPDEEIVYEDFEDVAWTAPDDLDAIDLDSLDDAIPADDAVPEPSLDAATDDLFEAMDMLDDALPALEDAATGESEADDGETGSDGDTDDATDDGADDSGDDEEDETADTTTDDEADDEAAAPEVAAADAPPDEPPAPPDFIYDVLLALPPDLGAQVLELRTTGEIDDMPPPGVALHAAFRAADRGALDAALANWTRAHLPIQIELTGIEAEINGTQQYVAAWTLDPLDELQDAQHDLRRTLAALATPLPEAAVRRHVHVIIGDHVKARRYPHVIGQMQRDYEPYVWHATELLLVQRDASAAPDDWTIARTFD